MEQLIGCVVDLVKKCDELHRKLVSEFRVDELLQPVCAFTIIANHLVQAQELMQFYSSVFPVRPGIGFEERLSENQEQVTRIMTLQGSLFVSIISCMEACAKLAIKNVKEYFPAEKKSKVTLREITDRAKTRGWLTAEDQAGWADVINIRNKIVHSNGEYGESYTVTLPNGLEWRFLRRRKAQITLRHYFETIDWMLGSYAVWCRACVQERCEILSYRPSADVYHVRRTASELKEGISYNLLFNKGYGYVFESKAKVLPLLGGELVFLE
ncbi:hypothetical protein PflCFBP13510_12570 [Pseudomonas fluorescens]|nr:hypothetical protein PflCFBP13510_12570 [Pseudomonas fluorescens]